METKEQLLICVDETDHPIGVIPKMEAHEKGILHRAFSVFIFNTKGEWLLQQRALSKYHSGGLWTNACCGHPLPGEQTEDAAQKRLQFEIGISCELKKAFHFIYRAELGNGLIEHEYDHVFTGISDQQPVLNPQEVKNQQYIPFHDLQRDISKNEHGYTEWFKMIFIRVHELHQKMF
ncbi:MAG: isopentenyl-diphosphate Delta-isomerase [Bacteroidetes bacterium]|nr:isopentenyl-diphosphate Delta-isomerase [Bacteroidota bacterium]